MNTYLIITDELPSGGIEIEAMSDMEVELYILANFSRADYYPLADPAISK